MELIDRKELLKAIERDSEGISGQYGDEWLFMKTIKSIPICAIPAIPLQKGTDVADLPSGVYRPKGTNHSEMYKQWINEEVKKAIAEAIEKENEEI